MHGLDNLHYDEWLQYLGLAHLKSQRDSSNLIERLLMGIIMLILIYIFTSDDSGMRGSYEETSPELCWACHFTMINTSMRSLQVYIKDILSTKKLFKTWSRFDIRRSC